MTIQESWEVALEQATPLDTYRAISAYEGDNSTASSSLGIATELFDGSESMADVELFVETSRRGRAVYTRLGMLTVSDGIDVDGLAGLYARRSGTSQAGDHEAIVARLMNGAHLAVAVSNTSRRGITAEYLRHRYEWWDEDTALSRSIGRAGITDAVYERNNIRQHSGGVKGPNYLASAAISGA